MFKSSLLTLLSITVIVSADEENVLTSEVFEIELNPPLFNWTYEGNPNQFVYQPSLLNAPDLPSWINYIFSERYHSGFLYGVPPNEHHHHKVDLEIIALNRKTYNTSRKILTINIAEKLNRAKYEVHMKIDNLNVDDIFDIDRMERLKDIYRKTLWIDSQNDLYVTFLASAIELGARRPPNPKEGEGCVSCVSNSKRFYQLKNRVVLRLGSQAPFSVELIELQEEVKPLWRVPLCPRDFKRTSVEILFRSAGFAMDWCSFRLIDDNNSALHQSITNEKLNSGDFDDFWTTLEKSQVPQRSYMQEFLFTLFIPMFIMVLLATILSLILCFHHEGINDPASEEFFNNLYHICTDYFSSKRVENIPEDEINQFATIHRATQSLRQLSNNRDISLSPDPILLSRSHTNSPTSTLNRGVHCRPSPPPYIRPQFKADL